MDPTSHRLVSEAKDYIIKQVNSMQDLRVPNERILDAVQKYAKELYHSETIKEAFQQLEATFKERGLLLSSSALSSSPKLSAKVTTSAGNASPVVKREMLAVSEATEEVLAPEEPTAENIVPSECLSYLEHFLSHALEKASKILRAKGKEKDVQALRDALSLMSESAAEDLCKIYPPEWFNKEFSEKFARANWSTAAEGERQKKAADYVFDRMYTALMLIEKAGISDLRTFHKEICGDIAKARAVEITSKGQVFIETPFVVKVPSATGEFHLKGTVTTKQLGDRIYTSIDPRKTPLPVNLHKEEARFETEDGTSVVCTQLRSGSFDMDRVSIPPLVLPKYQKAQMEAEYEAFSKAVKLKSVDDYVKAIRISQDAEKIAKLISCIEIYNQANPNTIKALIQMMPKLKEDWKTQRQHEAIIAANIVAVEEMLTRVDQSEEKLGFHLPKYVAEAFEGEELLDGKTWGMISLQTPANITEKGVLNKFIKTHAETLPGWISKLAEPDISELDPIDRERQAFTQALQNKKKKGFYFNIPTNPLGAGFVLPLVGVRVEALPLFTAGTVDEARVKKIQAETNESVQAIYDLTQTAINKLEQKRSELSKKTTSSKPDRDLKELNRYINALKSLQAQTFIKTSSGEIQLQATPGKSEYEIVGRLNVLMQMLNLNTTFHCRSGNNRTASLASKSAQIVADYAASETGAVTAPGVMAGKLAGLTATKDHWSLRVNTKALDNSLKLQKMNKGKGGTKESHAELGNKEYQNAVAGGAFEIAGPFSEAKLKKARIAHLNALMKETPTDSTITKIIDIALYLIKLPLGEKERSTLMTELTDYLSVNRLLVDKSFGKNFAERLDDYNHVYNFFLSVQKNLVNDTKNMMIFNKNIDGLLLQIKGLRAQLTAPHVLIDSLIQLNEKVTHFKLYGKIVELIQPIESRPDKLTPEILDRLFYQLNLLDQQPDLDQDLKTELSALKRAVIGKLDAKKEAEAKSEFVSYSSALTSVLQKIQEYDEESVEAFDLQVNSLYDRLLQFYDQQGDSILQKWTKETLALLFNIRRFNKLMLEKLPQTTSPDYQLLIDRLTAYKDNMEYPVELRRLAAKKVAALNAARPQK